MVAENMVLILSVGEDSCTCKNYMSRSTTIFSNPLLEWEVSFGNQFWHSCIHHERTETCELQACWPTKYETKPSAHDPVYRSVAWLNKSVYRMAGGSSDTVTTACCCVALRAAKQSTRMFSLNFVCKSVAGQI
jgi:hypothetical protein